MPKYILPPEVFKHFKIGVFIDLHIEILATICALSFVQSMRIYST